MVWDMVELRERINEIDMTLKEKNPDDEEYKMALNGLCEVIKLITRLI